MTLAELHSCARPFAVATLVLATGGAIVATALDGGLPGGHDAAVIVGASLVLTALSALLLLVPRVVVRLQALCWLVCLLGSATAVGGLPAETVARPLLELAILVALVMSVGVVMLQADESPSEARRRV